MARISAGAELRPFSRHIEPAVAGQSGQHRVGESEYGRFPARADILHAHPFIAVRGPASGQSRKFVRAVSRIFAARVAIEQRLCGREVQFMVRRSMSGRFLAAFALAGFMLAVAGCQSGDSGSVLGFGGKEQKAEAGRRPRSWRATCLAYCPQVTLREGTGFFNTYAKGGEDDPAKLIYQASISDVTRSCTTRQRHADHEGRASPGASFPGPPARPAPSTMPIRIAVMRGERGALLAAARVPGGDSAPPAQPSSSSTTRMSAYPIPAERSLQVFAGFDEGPAEEEDATRIAEPLRRLADHSDSAARTPGKSAQRRMTVSAPASVSASAWPG